LLKPPGQAADKRRGQRHRQGGDGNAPTSRLGAHLKVGGKRLQNALGGVEVEKRRAATQEQGKTGTMQARFHETSRFII
jgi:hypothetical protein